MNITPIDFVTNEASLRLGFFLTTWALVGSWEFLAPRRPHTQSQWPRWMHNFGLMGFNTLLVRVALPLTAVQLALAIDEKNWGLLQQAEMSPWITVPLAVIALDLTIYFQHRWFHRFPLFWRWHRLHHADRDFDVSTGVRFHPLEMLISMLIKWSAIALIGAPALSVLIFEGLLNASSLFNHGNIFISPVLDKKLRWLIVTPDMHRIHHSIRPQETHSNFGFNLPWWDRLFKTYRADPMDGQLGLTIGLPEK